MLQPFAFLVHTHALGEVAAHLDGRVPPGGLRLAGAAAGRHRRLDPPRQGVAAGARPASPFPHSEVSQPQPAQAGQSFHPVEGRVRVVRGDRVATRCTMLSLSTTTVRYL